MLKFKKFIVVIFVSIIGSIINGFIFSKLWFWFIVPTFQIQPIRIVEAIGIIFLINFINAKLEKETKEDFLENITKRISFTISLALVTLLSGYVLTFFI